MGCGPPWLGPEPPHLDPGSDLSRLYAAAERLAFDLDPARAPRVSDAVDFLCCAVLTLGPDPGMSNPSDARILVRVPSRGGVQVRVPVRAGVTSPELRAGFLALQLSDLGQGGEILVWRELVPSLADPSQSPDDGDDPRFSGEEPFSSWMELDLEDAELTVGDVLLYSRDAQDWSREAREGFEDLPLPLPLRCLDSDLLQAWVLGLTNAARPGHELVRKR